MCDSAFGSSVVSCYQDTREAGVPTSTDSDFYDTDLDIQGMCKFSFFFNSFNVRSLHNKRTILFLKQMQ